MPSAREPDRTMRGPEAAPALSATGIVKRFPGVVALDAVSFAVARGEIHALIGQNGAGKSTLVNLLSGMLAPDAGEIRRDGRPVALGGTRAALAAGIATVYQELSLLPNLTVAENLVLGREPRRFGLTDRPAMTALSRRLLDRIGLDIPVDRRVGRLALAERQLVEIAKALGSDPAVLILDEPTAPLGRRESERLFAILRRLREDGVALIYVSHRFGEILDLCDRATVLRNGRVVTTTTLETWTEARLTEAMTGRRSEAFAPGAPRPRRAGGLVVEGLGWPGRPGTVDLSVAPGEIVALTGLLGAGQNEIARLIGGDLRATAGRITLDGRPAAAGSSADAVRSGICLLTDDRKDEGIFPNQSLRANLALPSLGQRRFAGLFVSLARERRDTKTAKDRFGVVAPSLDVPMRTLSGGNQQKALIARWDLADAQVFILIEPTRGVDVGARADIYRRLDALARAGKSVLFVSSDPPEVLALADRVLVVRDGAIVDEVLPREADENALNLAIQGAAA